ncbi:MAG TPA: hypothetical protein VMB73_25580 [Acetobacteraceae bacterium]|nr:hypothetical protein [Acetobacteraceae bacterium]
MSASTKKNRPDFSPAIALFRDIAAQSGDALLTEGPVNPDHKLLDLCADALHHCTAETQLLEVQRELFGIRFSGAQTKAQQEAALRADAQAYADRLEHYRCAKPSLVAIAKIKATTPAGIYAKAAVVRASKTGAAGLAMSLAEDLLACPGLRALLWPGEAAQ